MLKERPAIAGIPVPVMPIGSPGMEVAGVKNQPFDVGAFTKGRLDERVRVPRSVSVHLCASFGARGWRCRLVVERRGMRHPYQLY